DSPAVGWRAYYLDGSAPSGAWLQLTITKTNGASVSVAVTNQSSGTMANLTMQLLNAVNAEPALQGSDGVAWDDYSVDPFDSTTFRLYAKNPGLLSAGAKARLSASSSVSVSPSGNMTLNQNLSDLQPRNHLYVTAGVTALVGN